ncbi:hypothetical protein ABBQ38_000346 [Trebouxia sp. C0009 RCD-2024]
MYRLRSSRASGTMKYFKPTNYTHYLKESRTVLSDACIGQHCSQDAFKADAPCEVTTALFNVNLALGQASKRAGAKPRFHHLGLKPLDEGSAVTGWTALA